MITITREALPPFSDQETVRHAWPLKLTATGNVSAGLGAAIFVYRAALGAPSGDVFECVASVQQMQELDLTPQVGTSDQIPYYRSAVAEFNSRSPLEAAETYAEIVIQVQELVDNYAAFLTLTQSGTVDIS